MGLWLRPGAEDDCNVAAHWRQPQEQGPGSLFLAEEQLVIQRSRSWTIQEKYSIHADKTRSREKSTAKAQPKEMEILHAQGIGKTS